HTHGALGHDFNEADADAWQTALNHHLRAGTTTVLATLASDTPARLRAVLETATRLSGDGLPLAGVHLEGPCLAFEQRGAHRAQDLLDADRTSDL
ncbi:hypothetical protein ACSNOK_33890, partial [Streptomyces sp. URMC 126]